MLKKIFVFFFKLFILGITALGFFIGLVYIGGFGPLPSKKDLAHIKQTQASIVYSEDAKIIGKFFLTNRTSITYNQLPKNLVNALVATEDSRFYEHKGIDKISLIRVLFKTIILGNHSSGGGSTLSQQLAKNLYQRKNFSYLSMPVNKTKEAILAYRLENIYTKKEILTLYFNTVPFGENVYGIESASQRYFSKTVHQLTLEEAAILVGILKANSYYNPKKHPERALQRRNVVLHQMLKAGFISEHQYEQSSRRQLKTYYKNITSKNPNGYFINQIKKKATEILKNYTKKDGSSWNVESDGLIIKTTLNYELQQHALKVQKDHLSKLQKSMDAYWNVIKHQKNIKSIINAEWINSTEYKRLKNKGYSNTELREIATQKTSKFIFDWHKTEANFSKLDSISHYLKMINAATYGIDIKTGAVKIYVGGNNYQYLPYNLIHSERQVASTFKPIVFTAALEDGQKPCDWINNEEKTYTEYENWRPQNYNHSNGGYYSMVGTLAKSMNIPTVETYFKIGHKNLQTTANNLGLDKELSNKPSVALGATAYSLQNMVHAYIPFATRKYKVTPHYISSISDHSGKIIYCHKTKNVKKSVDINRKTLETMQYLLKEVVDSGTAIKLKTQYKAKGSWAGKTGTSQNYSDSWFIGFNANIAIGTWVGCKYPSIHLPSRIGGGSVAALPIVAQIISKKYRNNTTNKILSAGFPKFSDEVIERCNCEFFREENTVEKFLDIFDKKEDVTPKEKPLTKEKKKKKRNFFNWIFGKKK